jgi:leucyl aminopeptidase
MPDSEHSGMPAVRCGGIDSPPPAVIYRRQASALPQGTAMDIRFAEFSLPQSGAVVVGVWEERVLTAPARRLDEATQGAVARAVAAVPRFHGKKNELVPVIGPPGLPLSRIVLAGLGKPEAVDARLLEDLGGTLAAHLNGAGETEATFAIDLGDGASVKPAEAAARLAFGAALRAYRFDKYRTKQKPEQKASLAAITVAAAAPDKATQAYKALGAAADSVAFTRDLVSEPANELYPESLAERAAALAGPGLSGLTVEVLDDNRLRDLGMGALLAVGQGSARPPRVVVMQYRGAAADVAPLAFIGKGVTFDTGGISIKPAGGMWDMKWDMAGAGVVIGLMRLLAARKARVNAVGLVGLVENMPSGNAVRPGDIVRSMSGQTIEVLNTDAEGRLVLADVLWYCQDRFKPKLMIDLATLTGAVIVALGHDNAGLFANNDELAERLIAAGKAVGEPVWRLPLANSYDRAIDSDAADIKNIAGDRAAGSIIGAQFVQRFVNSVPWAHLDIAGVAWSKKDAPTVPKGATAFGVRLLDRFVADSYEEK